MSIFLPDYLYNAIGLIGVTMMLIVFFLLQNGNISYDKMAYQLCNLIGALMVIFSLTRFWNLSSFVIEAFWVLISAWGLFKIIKKRREEKKNSTII